MADAATNMVTVLEHCRVSPPDHSVTDTLLPLTFFDMFWLNFPSLSRVYFYDLPCSTTELNQTVVPHLKKSLALTLKHYFPLRGNLITPTTLSNNTTPAIRYLNGDSVSLTVAEFSSTTSQGFTHLSGKEARDVDDLLALVPQLPPGSEDDGVLISPVLSVQVTLFPHHGFSVGFRNSHVVADGKSMSDFIRTWASINAKQVNGEDDHRDLNNLPFYDRSVIKDPKGIASLLLGQLLGMRNSKVNNSPAPAAAAATDLVQATLTMNRAQIQGLKDLVSAQVSTFVVVCGYVWSCMAKARQVFDENEVEHFTIAIDTRARLNPPIPSTYFGNAVSGCKATLKTRQLVEEEGFMNAVEEIRKAIHEKINNEGDGVLKGLDKLFDFFEATKGERKLGVSGSPKFDYYGTDFGWGKPKKYEVIAEKFGLIGSRDSDGDLEFVFCFPKNEMDAFTTIFAQGLIN